MTVQEAGKDSGICNARLFGEHEYMLVWKRYLGLLGKSIEYSVRSIVSYVFFGVGVLRVRRGFWKTEK